MRFDGQAERQGHASAARPPRGGQHDGGQHSGCDRRIRLCPNRAVVEHGGLEGHHRGGGQRRPAYHGGCLAPFETQRRRCRPMHREDQDHVEDDRWHLHEEVERKRARVVRTAHHLVDERQQPEHPVIANVVGVRCPKDVEHAAAVNVLHPMLPESFVRQTVRQVGPERHQGDPHCEAGQDDRHERTRQNQPSHARAEVRRPLSLQGSRGRRHSGLVAVRWSSSRGVPRRSARAKIHLSATTYFTAVIAPIPAAPAIR